MEQLSHMKLCTVFQLSVTCQELCPAFPMFLSTASSYLSVAHWLDIRISTGFAPPPKYSIHEDAIGNYTLVQKKVYEGTDCVLCQ